MIDQRTTRTNGELAIEKVQLAPYHEAFCRDFDLDGALNEVCFEIFQFLLRISGCTLKFWKVIRRESTVYF